MKVVLSPKLPPERFNELAQTWNEQVFARIEFSGEFSESDLEHLVNQAIALKPNDFSDVVLELVAVMPSVTRHVLNSILEHGDDGAREAVCERADLDEELRGRCLQS